MEMALSVELHVPGSALKKKPLISVLMPAHNAAAFVTEAVASILEQTEDDFEFIILDDASDDETYDVLCSQREALGMPDGERGRTAIKNPAARPIFAIVCALCLFCLLCSPAQAAPASAFAGRVVSVTDGDTITVLTADKQQVKIRLYGIGCPERRQPFGGRARQATTDAAHGKTVEVHPREKDRDGWTVAIVYVGESLNELLVGQGLAWVYPQFCLEEEICAPLRDLEQQARKGRKGLWIDESPVPPWEWRKINR